MDSNREQVLKLKDGRIIFKTNNGFKSFVQSQKGEVTEVTDEYYNQVKKNTFHYQSGVYEKKEIIPNIHKIAKKLI